MTSNTDSKHNHQNQHGSLADISGLVKLYVHKPGGYWLIVNRLQETLKMVGAWDFPVKLRCDVPVHYKVRKSNISVYVGANACHPTAIPRGCVQSKLTIRPNRLDTGRTYLQRQHLPVDDLLRFRLQASTRNQKKEPLRTRIYKKNHKTYEIKIALKK